jgi:hypothetical protein
MVLEKFLYVLLYRCGKFFDCKRGHTKETCPMKSLDVDEL